MDREALSNNLSALGKSKYILSTCTAPAVACV